MINTNKGLLLVLTGLSGSGKDSVMDLILNHKDYNFERIVTHNTRPPRDGEVHGKDYFFVSEDEFKSLIDRGEIIEYVIHGSFYKGTSKSELMKVFDNKKLIWRIEPSRAAELEEYFEEKFGKEKAQPLISQTLKIFLSAELQKVKQRYKEREAKSNMEEFEKRLMQDWEAFSKNQHRFDYVIDNNSTLKQTLKKVLAAIEKKLELVNI